MLDGLGTLVGGRVRLWRYDGRGLRVAGGPEPGWAPPIPRAPGLVPTPTGAVWLEPVDGVEGFWLEVDAGGEDESRQGAARVTPVIAALLDAERQRAFVAEELAGRYEEIDLLYAISEILGQTVQLEEATQTIVREVSAVVGARRASIMVFDERRRAAHRRGPRVRRRRPGAGTGGRRVLGRGAGVPRAADRRLRSRPSATTRPGDCGEDRGYRGHAYLSVPICYGAPGAPLRCVGVINLTDRIGGDRFTLGDRKLVAAVANQIGAAVENARLVERDLPPAAAAPRAGAGPRPPAQAAARRPPCSRATPRWRRAAIPADSVGGDFYTFTRLGRGRVGVMLGDVASHGFSAALVMALVMSAAGIHAAASVTPDETLERPARQPLHRAGRDRDVLQRLLRRARPARRPAGLRQRGPSLRLPGSALRRARAARGHRAAARARHRRQHPAPAGPVERGPRPARALDRRAGGRA